ncbi:MAG: glycoside hydrolase family 16 protein [Patescibacteria group bacterium]|nr:glycoside hydrolase family 16 protein [Patescibacteria group bacterium]
MKIKIKKNNLIAYGAGGVIGVIILGYVLVRIGQGLSTPGSPLSVLPFPLPQTSTSSLPSTTSTTETPEATLLQGMHMTFDDEFNTFSRYVDANGNVTCNPGGSGTWQTVYDFCSRTNFANSEAEVYIDPAFLSYLKGESASAAETDPDNPFSVSNGVLAIRAQPASTQVRSAVGQWAQYTSGIITTQFSFSQTYGYFEVRAKLPTGAGLWPAFWLLPEDKSWPPEIDALEAFGDPNPLDQGGQTLIHYASHATNPSQSCGNWYNVGVNITQGFHTYGVDVEPSGITYYFDGVPYATCPPNASVGKPMYMLINLAVGSSGSWPGSPNGSNSWPAYLYIDYVRAYQKS